MMGEKEYLLSVIRRSRPINMEVIEYEVGFPFIVRETGSSSLGSSSGELSVLCPMLIARKLYDTLKRLSMFLCSHQFSLELPFLTCYSFYNVGWLVGK